MKKLLTLIAILLSMISLGQTVTLDGSASFDPDGTISSYSWRLVSGPGTVTIANPALSVTTVTANPWKAGVYTFELKVTDNKGATALDNMLITVIPNPDIVTTNAGADFTVQLPVASFTLTGIATDPVGMISSYLWSTISGPNVPVISTPGAISTSISGVVVGVYQFRFKATSQGGASSADTVQVTVLAANVAPASNAGPDKTITLPVNSVSLGLPDASGLNVQWVKLYGTGTIQNPASSITVITGLKKGTSVFRKIVRNSDGMTASDDVTVKVKSCFFLFQIFNLC